MGEKVKEEDVNSGFRELRGEKAGQVRSFSSRSNCDCRGRTSNYLERLW